MPYKDSRIAQLEQEIDRLNRKNETLESQEAEPTSKIKMESLADVLMQAAQSAIDELNASETDQSSAEMRDPNGDTFDKLFTDPEPEEYRTTDDRIFDTFEQIVNRSIDTLNQVHTDEAVDRFLKYSLSREQWLDQSDYSKLEE